MTERKAIENGYTMDRNAGRFSSSYTHNEKELAKAKALEIRKTGKRATVVEVCTGYSGGARRGSPEVRHTAYYIFVK